jgi:predicted membrane channel-forming protein YqfA (hemolysin III family)
MYLNFCTARSVYLLWARPATSFPIQFMFYGFFLTIVVAVDTMGIIMFLKDDPTFLLCDLAVFLILGLIVFVGFFYILRNFKTKDSPVRG